MATSKETNLLDLENIKKYFSAEKGIFQRILETGDAYVHAVDNISLHIQENEIYGLCGESGCGKTTTARVIAGLDFETSGIFKWKGEQLKPNDRVGHSFRKKIQFIFQNPFQSLHPRMRVGQQVLDALIIQKQFDDPNRKKYVQRTNLGLFLAIIFIFIGLSTIFFAYPNKPKFVLPSLLSSLFIILQIIILILVLREIYYMFDYWLDLFIWLLNKFINTYIFKRQTKKSIPPLNIRFKTYIIKLIYFTIFFALVYVIGFDDRHLINIQRIVPFLNIAVSFSGARNVLLILGVALLVIGIFSYFLLNYLPKISYKDKAVISMFENVGLTPAETYYLKYPHQLSGGERQRVVIARALILNPQLIVADEPTSMLDVSIRASILELVSKMQAMYKLSVLLITHDLATVSHFCDKVAIMYVGEIVENGKIDEIFQYPRHPYTWALIKAIPVPDPSYNLSGELPIGDVADAITPPSGCRFHPRCQFAKKRCRNEIPVLETISPKQSVACHYHEELWANGSLKLD